MEDAGIAERKTASTYVAEIEKTGVLTKKKLGRENLYLNARLFELLAASALMRPWRVPPLPDPLKGPWNMSLSWTRRPEAHHALE